MSVELRPLGVPCNIRCQYCYQNPQRDAALAGPPYDLSAMKAAVEAEGGPFGLFGGEPLLVPEPDLEELFAWGLARFGESGIQTNGTLINERHIELFKKYRVRVGISIDGPGALNDARWAGTLELTRQATEKSQAAILALCRAGLPPSLIITLHRGNAASGRLELLCDWVRSLPELGITHVRLHLLEAEDDEIRNKYALTHEENLTALRRLQALGSCRLDVFTDVSAMLAGADRKAACVWRACDPYTTAAVRGVEGQGQRSNCGRTNKDGIEFLKGDQPGYERYLILYDTPQSAGGCHGCRFFLSCKGQCPGTALDGDWRNRSEHCEVFKALFAERERECLERGEEPLSLSPLRARIEAAMLAEWSRGNNPALAHIALRERQHHEQDLPLAQPFPHRRVRTCWASEKARSIWEPRLSRIAQALRETAWLSVTAGLRPCAVDQVLPEQLALRERELSAKGGALRVLLPRTELGERLEHQAAMGEESAVLRLRAAWNGGDVEAVGRELGYPACCAAAFARGELPAAVPRLPHSPLLNELWRPLGLGAAPHHPCSADCEPSLRLAEQLLQHGKTLGYAAELDWLLAILAWPVEWSCLHGIAEVRTPLLKFLYPTAYTAGRVEVRYDGSQYPDEGAQGLRFPYQPPLHKKLRDSQAHKRGLEHPIVSLKNLIRHGSR